MAMPEFDIRNFLVKHLKKYESYHLEKEDPTEESKVIVSFYADQIKGALMAVASESLSSEISESLEIDEDFNKFCIETESFYKSLLSDFSPILIGIKEYNSKAVGNLLMTLEGVYENLMAIVQRHLARLQLLREGKITELFYDYYPARGETTPFNYELFFFDQKINVSRINALKRWCDFIVKNKNMLLSTPEGKRQANVVFVAEKLRQNLNYWLESGGELNWLEKVFFISLKLLRGLFSLLKIGKSKIGLAIETRLEGFQKRKETIKEVARDLYVINKRFQDLVMPVPLGPKEPKAEAKTVSPMSLQEENEISPSKKSPTFPH